MKLSQHLWELFLAMGRWIEMSEPLTIEWLVIRMTLYCRWQSTFHRLTDFISAEEGKKESGYFKCRSHATVTVHHCVVRLSLLLDIFQAQLKNETCPVHLLSLNILIWCKVIPFLRWFLQQDSVFSYGSVGLVLRSHDFIVNCGCFVSFLSLLLSSSLQL